MELSIVQLITFPTSQSEHLNMSTRMMSIKDSQVGPPEICTIFSDSPITPTLSGAEKGLCVCTCSRMCRHWCGRNTSPSSCGTSRSHDVRTSVDARTEREPSLFTTIR